MSDLSPKLLERRRLREDRSRPWRDPKSLSNSPSSTRSAPATPTATPTKKPYLRRSYPQFTSSPPTVRKLSFRRTGQFPFLKLPYDIQVLVGQHVVQYRKFIKCEDFVSLKTEKSDEESKTPSKKHLSKAGYPIWIPFLQVCPWLTKDLSRTWYSCNTFYVKSVPEWNAFVNRATWDNVNRITKLHVDNELIYCPGDIVCEGSCWRSYSLVSPMKKLKTLTLYRDDGGPGTYTSGGHDDFNSVDWFVSFAENCPTLQYIKFALYPWTGFNNYSLMNSNMVAWIKDWEHEWNDVIVPRRSKGEKPGQSWYLSVSPNTGKSTNSS